METIYVFFFTYLIAATSAVQSNKSWVFNAKVNGTFVPLSANFLDESEQLSIFSYGDPSAVPTKFSLIQDNYAHTANQDMVGLFGSVFGFGPAVPPTPLHLDNDNKLLNGRFYSCQASTDTKTHRIHQIFYQVKSPYPAHCFEAHLYLLPDRNGPKSSQVTGNIFEKDEEPSNEFTSGFSSGEDFSQATKTCSAHCSKEEMSYHYVKKPGEVVTQQKEHKSLGMARNWPYVFFAKMNDTMGHLAAQLDFHAGNHYNVMWFGCDVGDPVEFEMRSNSAFSMKTSNDRYVGILEQKLVFDISAVDLSLDEHGRLRNADYYSCADPQDVHLITTYSFNAHCFSVEIYSLHFNTGVAKARKKNLLEKKSGLEKVFEKGENGVFQKPLSEVIKVSLEGDKSLLGKSEMVSKNEPYSLYVDIGGIMVPLGVRFETIEGRIYGVLCYGPSIGQPVKFIMEDNAAISIYTPDDGYLGIFDGILTFGKGIDRTDLKLDEDGSLHNAVYYTCWTQALFQFITTYMRHSDCFEVGIYLLHNDKDALKAMTKLSKENGSGEEQKEVKKRKEKR